MEKKIECEARTQLCSNEMLATYGVNGSEKAKPPQTFCICGACMVYLKRGGTKLKHLS